jgi:hypothetical protein
MPVECDEVVRHAGEQGIAARLPASAHAMEADLLLFRPFDIRAGRRGEELAAQADAEDGPLLVEAPAQEPDLVAQVRQTLLLVHGHSTAEHDQGVRVGRDGVAGERPHEAHVAQEGGKRARSFARLVLDDDHGGAEYIASISGVTRIPTCE